MTALIENSLYEHRIGGKRTNTAPRRQLRTRQNAALSSVAPAKSHISDAASLLDLADQRSGVTTFDGTPISSVPTEQSAQEEAPPPLAANSYIGSAENMRVDPGFQGIRIDSDPARVHHKTPEYMNHLGRVVERSEINPYTGQREDFYRQLPPEATKDYRLPKETMEHVNRRFIALQGYDHTKPKPARRARLAELPQPDGTYDEAATYMRRMGELRERVMRDVQVNMNGERPDWMRDHQRAFGFKGYQSMTRYVPDVPATMRADTVPFKPAADQLNNPNPANEVKVRGQNRDNAKRPHVEKVDWRGPNGAHEPAPPVMGEQTNNPTKRSATESEFVISGPAGTVHSQSMWMGQQSETSRKPEQVRDNQLYLSFGLTGIGAVAEDAITQEVFARIMQRTGGKNQGQLAAVPSGHGMQSARVEHGGTPASVHVETQAKRAGAQGTALSHPGRNNPNLALMPPVISGLSDQQEQHRATIDTDLATKYATAKMGANLPPMLSDKSQHPEQKRASVPQSLHSTYSTARQGANLPPVLSGNSQHAEQKRAFVPQSLHSTYSTAHQGAQLPPLLPTATNLQEQKRGTLPQHQYQTYSSARQGAQLPPAFSGDSQHAEQKRTTLPQDLQQTYATARLGADLPPVITGVTTHHDTKRDGAAGATVSGFSNARSTTFAAPVISGDTNRDAPLRVDMAGAVPSGLSLEANSVLGSYAVSRMIEHLHTRSEKSRVAHFQPPQATNTGAANVQHAQYTEAQRGSDRYTRKGGEMARGPAHGDSAGATAFASENVGSQKKKFEGVVVTDYEGPKTAMGVGNTVFGDQTKLDVTGKRASYGNVSSTQFMHGGGEGSGYHDMGLTAKGKGAFDKGVDRTNLRNLHNESQLAPKQRVGI